MVSPAAAAIPLLDRPPSYAVFCKDFLEPNRPCLVRGLAERWPARRWAACTSASASPLHPAFAELQRLYATHTVPLVQPGAKADDDECRSSALLPEAISQLEKGQRGYIKDWHLVQQLGPNEEPPYTPPDIFADDWMNNVAQGEDDFRFCYAGVQGSGTSLHRDDTSYSWSTNLVGRKRWRFFPPESGPGLHRFPDNSTSELASSIDDMDARQVRGELGLFKAGKAGKAGWHAWVEVRGSCIECTQEEGETIFVPSGWYHDVLNLTDCISLNHNWMNAHNLLSIYASLAQAVDASAAALSDVEEQLRAASADAASWQREWWDIVLRLVAADQGWAWAGFWRIVRGALEHAPCEARLRPPDAFVHARVRSCVDDFGGRPEAAWVDDGTRADMQRCGDIVGGRTDP